MIHDHTAVLKSWFQDSVTGPVHFFMPIKRGFDVKQLIEPSSPALKCFFNLGEEWVCGCVWGLGCGMVVGCGVGDSCFVLMG